MEWWNEEFWATAAITFASVAVTIGLTVWISWHILNRQLQHERVSQTRQRQDQLADLRAEMDRDRRMRQADGLGNVLARLQARIESMRNNLKTSNRERLGDWTASVTEARLAVETHEVRLARNPSMHDSLVQISECARLWAEAVSDVATPDVEWWEKWRAAAILLEQDILRLREQIPSWEDSGQLSLPGLAHTGRLSRSLTD